MATYGWLPPNTSSLNTFLGHNIIKVNKCTVFLLLQMTHFNPLPAGVRGWLKVTVHYKGNNFYKTNTKERAQSWEAEMSPLWWSIKMGGGYPASLCAFSAG